MSFKEFMNKGLSTASTKNLETESTTTVITSDVNNKDRFDTETTLLLQH